MGKIPDYLSQQTVRYYKSLTQNQKEVLASCGIPSSIDQLVAEIDRINELIKNEIIVKLTTSTFYTNMVGYYDQNYILLEMAIEGQEFYGKLFLKEVESLYDWFNDCDIANKLDMVSIFLNAGIDTQQILLPLCTFNFATKDGQKNYYNLIKDIFNSNAAIDWFDNGIIDVSMGFIEEKILAEVI